MVDYIKVSDTVKENVLAVYRAIAKAESKAHQKPVDQIHFHEVGNLDAVADVTAVCFLLEELQVDKVVVSPIHVGSGNVKCAHGILPVPAPATAHLLEGVPTYGGEIKGELCTPTGAALLAHFADAFGAMPMMTVEKTGYGMGKKDFERANCVRVMVGESFEIGQMEGQPTGSYSTETQKAEVSELSCNLDDMTGEEIGYAMDILLAEGALDVYWESIGMKKNRPGVKLSVICKTTDAEKFAKLLLKHTTTLGVRENIFKRYTLERKQTELETIHGRVRKKTSYGYGITKEKYEFEDLKKIANKTGLSIKEVRELCLLHSPTPDLLWYLHKSNPRDELLSALFHPL